MVIMNTDGLQLCCDEIREQNNSNEQCRDDNVILDQDVVMAMPTGFPMEWRDSSGGDGAATGMQMQRRVSFPNDKNLVTGYMEPADPWANGE